MKNLKYILVFFILWSCRTGLDLVEDSYYYETKNKTNLKVKIPLKSYGLKNFDIYVFNICEKSRMPSKDRFCECPKEFYDTSATDEMLKVEELYLLKHKSTDLVIYLTTFSHKYIVQGKWFLNDRQFYENNIVLDQIESAYIGKLDAVNNIIHFPSYNKKKDFILHYDPIVFPKELLFVAANVATAENNYSIVSPVSLKKVFSQPLSYKKEPYSISYYHGSNRMDTITPKRVDSLKLFSKNDHIELSFSFDNFPFDYKMAQKRIKYLPNFYLIQEH